MAPFAVSGNVPDVDEVITPEARKVPVPEASSKRGVVKELVELGKRSVSEELIKEFETVLAEADKLYGHIEKDTIEDGISRRKEIIAPR